MNVIIYRKAMILFWINLKYTESTFILKATLFNIHRENIPIVISKNFTIFKKLDNKILSLKFTQL